MKHIAILLALAACVSAGRAQEYWLGMLPQANLPLNLVKTDTNWLIYSPAQTDQAFPASEWSERNDTLRIHNRELGLKLVLRREDGHMRGIFHQGLTRCEMTFERASGLFEMRRPQDPQPPYPYDEEEVHLSYSGATLTGTLTMPRGAENCPAVLLVSGSGQQNQDEEFAGHKPFKVLADWLSRNGVAVLRYNDRGVGGSRGELNNATTLDFAADAEVLFDYLRHHKGVDPRRTGILGHSEGGLIAQIVASHTRSVAFVVMTGGPGCSGREVLLQQNEALFAQMGLPPDLVRIRLAYLDALFQDREPDMAPIEDLTADERKSVGLDKAGLFALRNQLAIPWMRTFLRLDPKDYLRKVRCPVLAIYGDKDCQVLAQPNAEAVRKLCPRHSEIHIMPGLNHLMQHCSSGLPDEYILIEETMSPEVMDLILNFIIQQ